ncbi:MAG: RluA family pseudouridine synthase [Clostridium sp.]|nr:RluA family pseudouridine synthase [Clostridium sp.]
MQTVVIGKNQAGQRLDKFLHKYLPEAGSSFLYKMLRKKNITLNGKKARGQEILSEGDVVESFFSEETFAKFAGRASGAKSEKNLSLQNVQGETQQGLQDLYASKNPQFIQNLQHSQCSQFLTAYKSLHGIHILYEDEDIVILNKPAGILTQKAASEDLTLNEWLVGYLLASGGISEEELATFHPSVCNRLDRNTSGIVLCGKSLAGSRDLSRIIKDHSLRKFYRTICVGIMAEDMVVEGKLVKDKKTNKADIKNQKIMLNREPTQNRKVILNPEPAKRGSMEVFSMEEASIEIASALNEASQGEYIKTAFHPLACQKGYTYLEVELFTGKTHQIRAQLAAMGHPVIGDFKYGDKKQNQYFREKYGLESQLLHACCIIFPKSGFKETLTEKDALARKAALTQKDVFAETDALKEVWGRSFTAPCPKLFEKIAEELFPEFGKEDKS